jgi:small conductance mechanosensitive channel
VIEKISKIFKNTLMKDLVFDIWNNYRDAVIVLGSKALFAFAVAFAGKIFVHIMGKIIHRMMTKIPRFDETFASMLRIVITYAVLIVCIIMILDNFGVNTTSLIALLGAAGVAVGLALKDTLSNIASGILLLLLHSYRKGDFIEFGSCSGTVKEMDLFTTSLETPEGIFIAAPNSSIWGVPLKNYTRNGKRRMDIVIGISYSDSIDTAFGVMRQIIAEEKRFLPEPAPQIMVQSLGDNSVNIMLRAWAPATAYWNVYWNIMGGIKDRIESAGLSIPFPQQDIHIIAAQDIKPGMSRTTVSANRIVDDARH